MITEFPVGAHVLFYRYTDSWSIIACFPSGYHIPNDAINFDFRTKPSLDEVYKHILKFHLDPPLSGGHAPAKDETSEDEEIPNGAIIDLERDKNAWKAIIRYPEGGMRFRSAPYKSIKDALDGISMNSTI